MIKKKLDYFLEILDIMSELFFIQHNLLFLSTFFINLHYSAFVELKADSF